MTIFLTGGAGKTSRRIAEHIKALSSETVITSSRQADGSDVSKVKFDWLDESTHTNPFEGAAPVTAVYIVLPPVAEPLPHVEKFIATARSRGATRFVFLSSTIVEGAADSPAPHGRLHHHLAAMHEADSRIEYAVLRPAFFMENFTEQQHQINIQNESTIYAATAEGTEAFISAEDIAAIGARCLLGLCELNCDYPIRGPEALSYGDVAKEVSRVTGRTVTYTNLSPEVFVERLVTERKMNTTTAKLLAWADQNIADGNGEKPDGGVEKVLGRKPIAFAEFAEKNKHIWMQSS